VTTPRGPEPSGRGGHAPTWSPLRAIAVLAVAVGLGAYLIDLGAGRHPAASGTSTTTTTTTAPRTGPKSTTTTTTTLASGVQPSNAVKVLVANASQTNGVAAYYSGKLAAAGWGTLTPVTATTTFPTSSVYYATGDQQAAARAIAAALGISSSAVEPLGPTVPVSSAAGADVVVVVGDDLAAKAPASAG
jgi:hypothetical protein